KALEEMLSSKGEEIVVAEFDKTIPNSGRIEYRGKFEKGLYLIRVLRKDDEEVFEWSTRKGETSDVLNIWVPEKLLKDLAEKEVEITIVRYDYSMHFKCRGSNFYFSPREGLIVEGREIELERVEPWSWSERHGASMVVKLKQRSILGAEVYFAFFEDGDFSIAFDEETLRIRGRYKATLNVEGNLLIIKYDDREAIVPISVQEWKEGEKYYLNIPVEGKERVGLLKELRKMFGYYNTEVLRAKLEEGELILIAHFDNDRGRSCTTGMLKFDVPEGAEVLEYIEIRSGEFFSPTWKLSDDEVKRIREVRSTTELGDIGRDKVAAVILGGEVPEIKNVKSVHREVYIRDESGRPVGKLDLVFETEDGHLIVVEVKATRNPNYTLGYLNNALDQLGEYKELIEKYGLNVGGAKKGPEGIEAYIVFSLYFDLENKVTKVIHEALPRD
ncbi:MAG: hypothetical protein FGF50_11585, partial [Candidatus Brockarchaeota archaeon]|nr:hypothetical protein [Candidatus Brockarchaeota archaeon]